MRRSAAQKQTVSVVVKPSPTPSVTGTFLGFFWGRALDACARSLAA